MPLYLRALSSQTKEEAKCRVKFGSSRHSSTSPTTEYESPQAGSTNNTAILSNFIDSMDATTEAEGFLHSIKPPRLEDAGLEDCALPPDLIKEAFRKAASAVKSVITTSDGEGESGGQCVDDPWEDSTDLVIGITDGIAAPSGGCVTQKGGGLTEAPGDEVAVFGGDPNETGDTVLEPDLPVDGDACVDGLQGLEIGGNGRGILGKKLVDRKADVDEGDEDGDKPTLTEGYL